MFKNLVQAIQWEAFYTFSNGFEYDRVLFNFIYRDSTFMNQLEQFVQSH